MYSKYLPKMSNYAAEVVERRIATSGQRVHASSQTSRLSPKGKGPQRSMCTSCHGLPGITVGLSGSAVDFPQRTGRVDKPLPLSPLDVRCLATTPSPGPSVWFAQFPGGPHAH